MRISLNSFTKVNISVFLCDNRDKSRCFDPVISARKVFRLVLVLLFLLPVLPGRAQSNLLFYWDEDGLSENPARVLKTEKFSFSILPIGGTSLSYNSHQDFRHALDVAWDDPTEEEANEVIERFLDKKKIFLQTELNWLNVSVRTKKGAFNFRVKESVYGTMSLKGDLLRFMLDENEPVFYSGQHQAFPGEGIHYRQYSLGYATRSVRKRLDVGVRANLYFGKSFLTSDFSGTINADSNGAFLSPSGYLKYSAPVRVIRKSSGSSVLARVDDTDVGDYLRNKKNTGAGLDLGMTYHIDPYLDLSFSVVNVGKINFASNLQTLRVDGQARLSPDQVSVETLPDGTRVFSKNVDEISLQESFEDLYEVDDTEAQDDRASLPSLITAGINYEAGPSVFFSVTDQFVKHRGLSYNRFLLAVSARISRHWSVRSGYSAISTSYLNIPLAVQYKWWGGTAFLSADNILVTGSASDVRGLFFGVNFYPFKPKVKYQDVPYLPFFKKKKGV